MVGIASIGIPLANVVLFVLMTMKLPQMLPPDPSLYVSLLVAAAGSLATMAVGPMAFGLGLVAGIRLWAAGGEWRWRGAAITGIVLGPIGFLSGLIGLVLTWAWSTGFN